MVRAKTLLAVAAAFLVGCLSHGAAAAPKRQNAPSPILQKQLQEMRTAILRAWDPGGFEGTITVRVHLKRDGTVDGSPEIVSDPTDAGHYQAAATSAVRAVMQTQPFTMLGQNTYERWKEMDIDFDPADVSR
jgi:colicin import membrane protein